MRVASVGASWVLHGGARAYGRQPVRVLETAAMAACLTCLSHLLPCVPLGEGPASLSSCPAGCRRSWRWRRSGGAAGPMRTSGAGLTTSLSHSRWGREGGCGGDCSVSVADAMRCGLLQPLLQHRALTHPPTYLTHNIAADCTGGEGAAAAPASFAHSTLLNTHATQLLTALAEKGQLAPLVERAQEAHKAKLEERQRQKEG